MQRFATCLKMDEDNMGVEEDYVKLTQKIPRKVILTRLEFLIMSILYRENRAMRYSEITSEIVKLPFTPDSTNISLQLKGLQGIDVVDTQADGYTLTNKGRSVLRSAATLARLLTK